MVVAEPFRLREAHTTGAEVWMSEFDAKARTWDDDPQKVMRARRVADLVAARVPGLQAMDVLEYGSGTGLLGLALHGRVGSLTLADASREMTAVAREKIAALAAAHVVALQLDLSSGALPPARYDLVCTLLTLHHIRDTDGILRSFHDLLRPGGHVCISDLDAEDGSFHGQGFDGHPGFRRDALAARLAAAGFGDVRLETAFEIEKAGAAGARRYPAFLAVARRA
jgi:2-polyprenyl-3-methyl-5-hydroxy-6-metoxy-1,4-benzoquinol methylase